MMGLIKGKPIGHMLLITPSETLSNLARPGAKASETCIFKPPIRSISMCTFKREPGSPKRRTLVV